MPPESHEYQDRFIRQLTLPGIGSEGQRRLEESKVAIIGLGGLGSPVALYLAAAGVGRLVLVDPDEVSLSNLHRQVIHSEQSLGKPKIQSAASALSRLNSRTVVTSYQTALTSLNAGEITAGCRIIVDATDNYAARFVVSDAAARLKVPMMYGAIRRFEGQACLFEPHNGTACYRCLHPEGAPASADDTASSEGLLGPMPGIIGSIQAMETLKFLLGLPSPLSGVLLSVDAMSMTFRKISLKNNPSCACSA